MFIGEDASDNLIKYILCDDDLIIGEDDVNGDCISDDEYFSISTSQVCFTIEIFYLYM